MPKKPRQNHEAQAELLHLYALDALPSSEATRLEAHISTCEDCQHELGILRSVVDTFTAWPLDLLRPSASLRKRLAGRIGVHHHSEVHGLPGWVEPE